MCSSDLIEQVRLHHLVQRILGFGRILGRLFLGLQLFLFRAQIFDPNYVTANTGSPEQFDAFIREQTRQVRELVSSIGIKPEE